jgi:hypothetical protein
VQLQKYDFHFAPPCAGVGASIGLSSCSASISTNVFARAGASGSGGVISSGGKTGTRGASSSGGQISSGGTNTTRGAISEASLSPSLPMKPTMRAKRASSASSENSRPLNLEKQLGDRMRKGLIGLVSALAFASTMVSVGCGSNPGKGVTGGSSSTGGAVGSGGSSSTGGAVGSGGSSSTGGKVGSGGSSSTGGQVGSGGSSSTGGQVGSGGSSSTGGKVGSGGSSSTGGQAGGGASGEGSVTTLSGTEALNALTAADATQLCKDTYAYFGKAIPMATACKYKGLSTATSSSASTDSQMQQICTDHETACTQAGSGVGSADNPGCSALPSTCTATVTQYSACISDEVAIFIQGMSGLPSCATATSASISAVWEVMAPTSPDSCDSLANKCPELSPPTPNN